MLNRTRNSGVATAAIVRPTSSVAVAVSPSSPVRLRATPREMQTLVARRFTALWAAYGKFAVIVMALAAIASWRGCSLVACWGQAVCVIER